MSTESHPSQEGLDLTTRTPAARRRCIAALIGNVRIHSQTELQQMLAREGFIVSQGTLSRDLSEMRASKVRVPGGSVYVLPEAGAPGQVQAFDAAVDRSRQRLATRIEQFLVSVRTAHSDVVLQTPPGAAQLLAAALDEAMLPGIMGTIAGDDTILIATTSEATGASIAQHIAALASDDVAGV